MTDTTCYTDLMTDCETTGLRPDRAGIIQLSAVKFNLRTQEVSPSFFNRSLKLPPWRHWDQGTVEWWSNKPDVLREIILRAEDPGRVMNEFFDWVAPAGSMRFWSKPSSFDYMFVSSYFHDFGLPNPFSYREVCDLGSFTKGLWFSIGKDAPNLNNSVSVPGAAHNALNDCLWQLKLLFKHIEEFKKEVSNA